MQCPRCHHDNRESARFCGECGVSLVRGDACPRCATVSPPGQRFCDACGERLGAGSTAEKARRPHIHTPGHLAEKILRARGALEGERKQVTVLFADVVHSMQLAEGVDAEEWHRVLDRFFQLLADGIHCFEGTINQFTGDGIMALFGAPIAHEDHARRGCHAALQIKETLRDYARALAARGLEFAVRMGLNSGEVVLGRIGEDLRMDYTAVGHTVGLAARMEQLAAPGTVCLTEHTARLVEGFFTLRDRGTPPMRGVSVPVRVYELEGVGPLRTRLDASRRRGFSRLVGREEELAWLAAILELAVAGDGQVVGVVGDAGVGKSRVCLEFVERCRAQGIAVHEAHCPSHGAAVPLLPIRELVRSCLTLGADEPEADVRRKVADRLLALELGLDDALPLVLELLGVPDPEASSPVADAHTRHGRLAEVMRRVLRAASAAEPVVLLVDDAHWIDPASDDVLRELAEGRGREALWSEQRKRHHERVGTRRIHSPGVRRSKEEVRRCPPAGAAGDNGCRRRAERGKWPPHGGGAEQIARGLVCARAHAGLRIHRGPRRRRRADLQPPRPIPTHGRRRARIGHEPRVIVNRGGRRERRCRGAERQ